MKVFVTEYRDKKTGSLHPGCRVQAKTWMGARLKHLFRRGSVVGVLYKETIGHRNVSKELWI